MVFSAPLLKSVTKAGHSSSTFRMPSVTSSASIINKSRIDHLHQAITLPQKDPSAIHINLLDYIMVILELGIAALEDATSTHMAHLFPDGNAPTMPVLLIRSDNMVSFNWTNNVSANSTRG
jgi:hypothetical protein